MFSVAAVPCACSERDGISFMKSSKSDSLPCVFAFLSRFSVSLPFSGTQHRQPDDHCGQLGLSRLGHCGQERRTGRADRRRPDSERRHHGAQHLDTGLHPEEQLQLHRHHQLQRLYHYTGRWNGAEIIFFTAKEASCVTNCSLPLLQLRKYVSSFQHNTNCHPSPYLDTM